MVPLEKQLRYGGWLIHFPLFRKAKGRIIQLQPRRYNVKVGNARLHFRY
jgi:hypothetical protein